MAGFVDFEAENAGHVGVFGGRRKALREDVGKEMRESSAKVGSVDVGASGMDSLGVVEVLAAETEEFYESLARKVCLSDWEHELRFAEDSRAPSEDSA